MSDPFIKFREQLQRKREPLHTPQSEIHSQAEKSSSYKETDVISSPINEVDESNASINRKEPSIIPKLDYVFMPNSSITVQDLSRVLAFMELSISEDLYNRLPLEIKQYFIKYTEKS